MLQTNEVHIFYHPESVEYGRAGHPERPQRISATVPFLKKVHPGWSWHQPEIATREELLRAHSADYIDRVAHARMDFDSDCPVYRDIFHHAARAAGATIAAARGGTNGRPVFSLMRPPGHHALREQAMGFCYFGNVALAALDALSRGIERVAIWDFDAHHGNGTEALLANENRVVFASIHQYPGWPGTGTKSFRNIHNFPVAPYSPRAEHMGAAEQALELLLRSKPELLLVSAGFDAFVDDPITQMTLETEDFATFGKWLRQSAVPAAATLEGGYSDELPTLIDAFLSAWAE